MARFELPSTGFFPLVTVQSPSLAGPAALASPLHHRTGGSGAARRFEGCNDKSIRRFFEKVYLTKGITVGEAPKYSAWEHEFAKYKGQIPKTRSLTKYTPDAVFLPEGKKEAWVIETQFELNYEAVGQALAYWYAYERVKRGISGLTFSKLSREKETQNVSEMLQGALVADG